MALTPSGTRDLLARLGHRPKRSLGQNFLVDGNIVRKSLELARIAPHDAAVEIGPGLGTLTEALLEAGADVWAIERDRALFEHLSATLGERFPHTFRLLEGDAVGRPLAGLPGPLAPRCKIVANLPYAISTPWMDAVLSGPLPARMVLMLQREAAERYTAAAGSRSFGAISIFLQAAFDTAPGHRVSGTCFHPRPDVDSTLLHLVRKPEPHLFSAEHKLLIRSCFQQRRKQIGAVIRARRPELEAGWRELLAAAGFSLKVRAEAIPVPVWIRMVSGTTGPA